MSGNIRADIQRFHRADSTASLVDVLRLASENFGLQALMVYRFGQWLRTHQRLPGGLLSVLLCPLYLFLAACIRLAYGIRLEQSAEIGRGLYIGHFGGIRVAHCRLGEHCSIQQHVRLGPSAGGPGPSIGDRVWIGAHAEIVDSVHIGDGATIGAGAVVSQDVPAGCLVLGNPGRIVRKSYDNSAFL